MQPGVIKWYKIYCAVLCFLYLFTMAGSLIFLLPDPSDLEMSRLEALILGGLLLGIGFVLFAACLLPLLLKPRPWLWVYGIVIICLGMTSACFLPACVPLLIFWLKPETKAYFATP